MQGPVPSWHGKCIRVWVLPRAPTGFLAGPEGRFTASGVESTHISGKETAALMPRKNLLSLFADFARFGGDVAVIQRRGYRREKLTYTELLDSAASPDFVQRAIKDAGVKLILRESQQAQLPGLPPSMIINDFSAVVNGPVPSQNAGPHPGKASARSTIAEILYTSGTTPEPRGVV